MKIEKITTWCDKATVLSYYALIYFLPISNALCESFAGATLFLFFVKRGFIFGYKLNEIVRIKGSILKRIKKIPLLIFGIVKPVDSFLSRPIGFFILACALSILKSQYLTLSLSGFFFKVLQWAYLYFVFIECMKTPKQLKIFFACFIASATLVCVNGLFQNWMGHDFIFGESLSGGRINSTFRHANDFGGYLLIVSIAMLSLLLYYNKNQESVTSKGNDPFIFFKRPAVMKTSILILFTLMIICLGMTYSRGAWLGFFIALFFIGLKSKKGFLISLIIICTFLFLFYFKLIQKRNVNLISDNKQENIVDVEEKLIKDLLGNDHANGKNKDLSDTMNNQLAENAIEERSYRLLLKFGGSGRSWYWIKAISIIKENPVFGIGLNTYARFSAQMISGGYPHNSYLQMAAETGLVGLSMFLWILGALYWNSLSCLRIIRNSFQSSILFGLLIGFLGFLIHSFFDSSFYSVKLGNLMWVTMGAIVAVQRLKFNKNLLETN